MLAFTIGGWMCVHTWLFFRLPTILLASSVVGQLVELGAMKRARGLGVGRGEEAIGRRIFILCDYWGSSPGMV